MGLDSNVAKGGIRQGGSRFWGKWQNGTTDQATLLVFLSMTIGFFILNQLWQIVRKNRFQNVLFPIDFCARRRQIAFLFPSNSQSPTSSSLAVQAENLSSSPE